VYFFAVLSVLSRVFSCLPEPFRVYPSLFVFRLCVFLRDLASFLEFLRLSRVSASFREFFRLFKLASLVVFSIETRTACFDGRTSRMCHILTYLIHTYIWMRHITHGWATSQMNESCHIWTSHVTDEWVMPHMNEPCHRWMSHVTYERAMSYRGVSCARQEGVTTWHNSFIRMSVVKCRFTYECEITGEKGMRV